MAYRIEYSHDADLDVDCLPRSDQVLLRAVIDRLLKDEPEAPSHRRRPIDPNPFSADWEVRQGDLRAFYTVDRDANVVRILAAGVKRGNDLYVRGQTIDLRAPSCART